MVADLYPGAILALIGGVFIAASSTLNLLMQGRITGMSSIFYTMINWDMKEGLKWKVLFVIGMLTPVFIMYKASGNGEISGQHFFYKSYLNIWALSLGGFFVGMGTKIGNGCTSGHAVCGIPRLSKRSIVATCLFLGFGVGVGTLFYHLNWIQHPKPDEASNWGSFEKAFLVIGIILAIAAFVGGVAMFVYGVMKSNSKKDIVDLLLAYLYGVLFGTGLAISGMCNPGKIIGFLALNENWDPSLIFVMVSAVGINLVTFQLILKKRESPVLLGKFPSPKSEFDLPVIVGPCIFGIGWGISGLCPGPGMLNFFILPQGFIFIIALAIGQFIGAKLIVPLLTPAPAQTPTSQPLTQS